MSPTHKQPLPPPVLEPAESSASSSSRPTSSPSGEVLDLRGEVCPYTFVLTKLRMEELAAGQSLTVLVDHEPATRNVPRSAREWGQAVDAVETAGDGLWRIVLRKQ